MPLIFYLLLALIAAAAEAIPTSSPAVALNLSVLFDAPASFAGANTAAVTQHPLTSDLYGVNGNCSEYGKS